MGDHWLRPLLASYGEQPAMLWKGAVLPYAALCSRVDRWVSELHAREIRAGECVAISGDYSPDVCALLIALIINRNVAVPLPRVADARREESMQIANVGPVFTFDRDGFAAFFRRPTEGVESPLMSCLRERRSPGLVLFSSGSSGKSKASLLDFDRLISKFQQQRRRAHRTITFLLVDHIGGINTLFHVLCNGGMIVPIEDRRPDVVCQAIQELKVELLPTTPTFLKMLLISEAHQRYDLSSLTMITYGTEPMPRSTLEHLRRALPSVELKQTYGLSELGILHTKSRESGSLWVKVGGDGFKVKIVNGTLWIKSESAMLGYLNAPAPFDEEGWFNTGDLVQVDGEYVRILGRNSEMINVGGEKVFPTEIESVLLEMDNIVDALVAGKPSPVTGQIVTAKVLLRVPERREELIRRVRMYCKDRLAPYKIPVVMEISDDPLHGDRFKKARVP
jgi:long-chain acyl-CoA synthetase